MNTPIYWILFYEKPQQLQNLAAYQDKWFGQKLDKPSDIFPVVVLDGREVRKSGKK